MSEALDFVKKNMEGKDLSILPGSIKWVVDSQIVFMSPEGSEVTEEDAEAACTMVLSLENFMEMADGKLDGTMAFMSGKLKIQGDMGIAMKLAPILA